MVSGRGGEIGLVMPVLIVGGGISGLSAAYFLCRRGFDCTLVDEQPRLGGVIRTERVAGCLAEAGPDSFLSQKPWALELIRELGMEDQVIGSNDRLRRTYIVRRGRLVPLPDGMQFLAPTRLGPILATPLFGPGTKWRMAAEWFRRPAAVRRERTVAEFIREHFGPEAVEYLAQPLLRGVYGGDPEQLSADSVLPRFVEMEKRHGSLTRGALASQRRPEQPAAPLFLSLREGMQSLVDRIVAELASGRLPGAWRRLQARALRLEPRPGGGWRLVCDDAEAEGDSVVLAVPCPRAAELCEGFDGELSGLLGQIRYSSPVTAAFVYRRPEFAHPLDGFGFLVPRAEKRLLAACTWVNTKFPHRAPPGKALLRAFVTGAAAEEASASALEDLAAAAQRELAELMALRAQPEARLLRRWDRAMALYGLGHQELAAEIDHRRRRHKSLYLGGNGYSGIGIPDCIRRSRLLAEELARVTSGAEASPKVG